MSRRVPDPKKSVSTNLQSGISLLNRQKVLQALYREFRSAMTDIEQLSADPADEVIFILHEIELLETETEEILALLSNPKISRNPRGKNINKRLSNLQRINLRLRGRAESLADVE
jgi:hypothetical protein